MAETADGGRRARAARPVADLVGATILQACRKRGFAAAEIVMLWSEIIDPEIAAATRPERIDWPRRTGYEETDEPATLVLACDGSGALIVTHQAPQIIDRLNAFLGWRAIGRVRVVQRPRRPRGPPRRPPKPALSAAAESRLAEITGGIGAPGLAAAVARLGRGALAEVAADAREPHNRPIPRPMSGEESDRAPQGAATGRTRRPNG